MVKVVSFKKTSDLLGKSLKIYMKDGAKFYFKVTEVGPDYIAGYDDEMMNLRIDLADIDFVMEG
jgi:hypothetical protein